MTQSGVEIDSDFHILPFHHDRLDKLEVSPDVRKGGVMLNDIVVAFTQFRVDNAALDRGKPRST
jgi:hypothetical protein